MQQSNDIDQQQQNSFIENRSIDFIPENERHGSVFSQFTLWFGANLQITAIVTGALAVVLGGDVFWSIIGLIIGQAFGASIMALHAAQGPKLGLPQMISSRVQFGVYGACIPIFLVSLMYIGFTATGTVLSGQAIAKLFNISNISGIVIFASIIIVLATVGYKAIHWIGKVASILGMVTFSIILVKMMLIVDLGSLMSVKHFNWSTFLLAVSLSASWQIAFGPYVADYSRYLPKQTSSSKVFWAVALGSFIGSQISMTLGVFIAQIAQGNFVGNEVAYVIGLGSAGAIAALLYFSIAFGKLTISTLNSYGCFMCIATIYSGFKGSINITKKQRLISVLGIVAISTVIAILGEQSFLNTFKSFILFLLTFFIPWSAINLVDYYFISKEKCEISALSDPNGIYGRWNMIGIGCYVAGILFQLPFIHTKIYQGKIAELLGGVDLSWIMGLFFTALLYFACQKIFSGIKQHQLKSNTL
ncbi:cytosine permease [Acinetobacter sp. IK40]|jgi:nucleobase:cation symporter-1, NCS1 family|uniref:purine-cytosine permease family protein n=1 Tax=Acinetobacter sp. IK40 TaxID=2928897 RepID=UPI002D1EE1E1|nr:cytosine permease [Acinetobacter sp. IK40]MEB3792313.1 cytosine permease [Acinetobacter sp. IK40]